MSKPHIKLFIPGPVEVYPDVYAAMSRPLIGHRSGDFAALYKRLQPKMQKLFYTNNPIYLMTSSSWGAMEASIRNCVQKKILVLSNGAFSDHWYEVALNCGKQAEQLKWEWGTPIDPTAVEKKLSEGGFDAICFIHNETAVGLLNPLEEIMTVVRKFPEVISIVDTVSIFSVVKIPQDELGIDIMLTGSQKALALPPGMALVSVSPRALDRAKNTPGRGFYFDFMEMHSHHELGLTPSTPNIPLIYALEYRCDQIETEGLENRYARHHAMNKLVVDWCVRSGFPLLPPKGFVSPSLVCARNDRGIDLDLLNKRLKTEYQMMINTGYGKLHGKSFRISTMGDETVESVQELLNNLDRVLVSL